MVCAMSPGPQSSVLPSTKTPPPPTPLVLWPWEALGGLVRPAPGKYGGGSRVVLSLPLRASYASTKVGLDLKATARDTG